MSTLIFTVSDFTCYGRGGGQKAPDTQPGPDGQTDGQTHTHKAKPIHPRYAGCNTTFSFSLDRISVNEPSELVGPAFNARRPSRC